MTVEELDGRQPEHFDVLIVGAGLSGIGAAYRLQTECRAKTYAILERRTASGGTWDLFRYPGVRSDSDMFTLGYPFRPWRQPRAIADGPDILHYLRDTAAAYGIDRHIRYDQKVVAASWDSDAACWTLEVQGSGIPSPHYTCRFLYLCTGYYSYDGGYRPELPGVGRFQGKVVHPQEWPDDLDYTGKKVVVVGSGATAITLVPAMAKKAAQVTMVQRSPTYVASLPRTDPVAARLARVLPPGLSNRIARWRSVFFTQAFYLFCQHYPEAARRFLRSAAARQLPDGYQLDPNFNPAYNPWDQRMCLVPDGDLFQSIAAGTSSVVTDHIETFTETGLRLESGVEIEADLVVLATGLKLVAWGGIALSVDGTVVDSGTTLVYRGCLLSGVPNLAFCIGYTNASWTLRADLSSRYVCRLINYMAANDYVTAVPTPTERVTPRGPVFALKSGYVERAASLLPKQGDKDPWRFFHNYPIDLLMSRAAGITASMEFARSSAQDRRPAVRGAG